MPGVGIGRGRDDACERRAHRPGAWVAWKSARRQEGDGEAAADGELPALLEGEATTDGEVPVDGEAAGRDALAPGVLPGLQATTAAATAIRRVSRFSMHLPHVVAASGPQLARSNLATVATRTLRPCSSGAAGLLQGRVRRIAPR